MSDNKIVILSLNKVGYGWRKEEYEAPIQTPTATLRGFHSLNRSEKRLLVRKICRELHVNIKDL